MNTYREPWERLREERERLGLSQTEFAACGGVKKLAQIRYEKGERKPTADYMIGIAKAGADVAYIVSGQRAALQDALQNIRVASEAAAMLAGTHESLNEIQDRIFHVLHANKEDEAELLENYRRCAPPDQKTIRQMAERLAADAPGASAADAVIGNTLVEVKSSAGDAPKAARNADKRSKPAKKK